MHYYATVTTEVQRALVVFSGQQVTLTCELATGSSSSKCNFVFTQIMSEKTENITVQRNCKEVCRNLTETRGAYAVEVLVYSDDALQPYFANIMEETENFTCQLPDGKFRGNTITATSYTHTHTHAHTYCDLILENYACVYMYVCVCVL